MKLFDRIPLVFFVVALILGLAPMAPEPHLVEKLRMLAQGTLSKPIDIFDLCLHGTAMSLFIIKLVRVLWLAIATPEQDDQPDQ